MIQIGHLSIRDVIIFLASFSFAATLPAADIPPTGKRIRLFDGKSLEQFDTVIQGRGLNNDPDGTFRVHDGMVHVSGTPYGYFITKKDYGDYYLRAEFKWGEATHAPRKDLARDSGILFHAPDTQKRAGLPGSIFPTSIEFQIMEGSTGDVILVKGPELTVNGVTKPDDAGRTFDRFNKTPWPGGAPTKRLSATVIREKKSKSLTESGTSSKWSPTGITSSIGSTEPSSWKEPTRARRGARSRFSPRGRSCFIAASSCGR